MHDPTHAPGWRGRPVSYTDLRRDDDQPNPLELFCYFGCAIGALVCLAAAGLAWAPEIARLFDRLL